MDFTERAAAWITASLMKNEFINDMTGILSDYMDVDDVKFMASLAMEYVPHIVALVSPELGAGLEVISEVIELAQLGDLVDTMIDNTIEFVALTLEDPGPKEGSMELMLIDILSEMPEDKPESSLEELARADAETTREADVAVVVVEELTVIEEVAGQLEILLSEEQQQEVEALENKFEQEMTDRMETIDKMEDRYFKNHPDLSEGKRADAETRFEEIRTEERTALEDQLTARVAEVRAPEHERREDPEEKRKEQERS